MDMTKRVIILNKLDSPLIAQAIFILKDGAECEFSAVAEAERIVAEYMTGNPSVIRKKRFLPIVFTALAAVGILLSLILR